MATLNNIRLNGTTYTIGGSGSGGGGTATQNVFFGSCSTQGLTVAKSATVSGTFALAEGVVVLIKMSYANAASVPTLNVNSTGTKSVYRVDGAENSSLMWEAGAVVPLVYDGTNWLMISGTQATTEVYGAVKLSSATDGTSETLAATSKAVADALTAAKSYADKLIGGIENGTY